MTYIYESAADIPNIYFTEQASKPTQPGTGDWQIYFKSTGLFVEDDAGTEYPVVAAGGSPYLDNVKALFGTDSDMAVYYTGSHGVIDTREVGSGDLILQPNGGGVIISGAGSVTPDLLLHVYGGSAGSVAANTDADVVIENSTSTGLNVLTADNQFASVLLGSESDNAAAQISWRYSTNYLNIGTSVASGFIRLITDNETEAGRITSGGHFLLNTDSDLGLLTVVGDADEIQAVIRANSSQSANVAEVQKSDTTVYGGWSGEGKFFVGTSANVNSVSSITGTSTAVSGDNYGLLVDYTAAPSGVTTNVDYFGLDFIVTMADANTQDAATLAAVNGVIDHRGEGTIDAVIAYRAKIRLTPDSADGVITDGIYFYGQSAVDAATGTGQITNLYGIYLDDMDAGTTSSYSIYTKAGNAVFNADGDGSTNMTVGGAVVSANYDLGLVNTGALMLAETTTPTADADNGKIYTKNDNKLYFQDGGGTEHEIAFV